MSSTTRTRLGLVCAVVALGFLLLWFVGQEASGDPQLDPPAVLVWLYPGSWAPAVRGAFWIVAGAAAVGFDLFVVRPAAVTAKGRAAALAFAVVTGVCFAIFAAGTFAQADWSVIH